MSTEGIRTETSVDIVVRTISNQSFQYSLPLTTTINELKTILTTSTNVSSDRQRLIFRGRVLDNDMTLLDSGLENGHVLQLVTRPDNYQELRNQSTSTGDEVAVNSVGTRISDFDILNQLLNGESQSQSQVASSSSSSFERTRQGLATMQTIMSTMPHRFGSGGAVSSVSPEDAVDASTEISDRRTYYVGQWVDIKDTVSQWLEATVIQVDDEGRRIFVHYNGWPVRWDEWLSYTSPRIAPFRTRTLHAPQRNQQLHAGGSNSHVSPVPMVVVPDAPPCLLPTSLIESARDGEDNLESHIGDRSIGQDDTRVMLIAVTNMARRLMPLLEAASELSAASLRNDRSVEVTQQQQQQQQQQQRQSSDGTSNGAGMHDSLLADNTRHEVDESLRLPTEPNSQRLARQQQQLQSLTDDLCPLVDRFGRVLTEVAPMLRSFSSSLLPTNASVGSSNSSAVTGSSNNTMPADYFPVPEYPSNYNMFDFRDLASLLRPRPPSPLPIRAFRQPVSTSVQTSSSYRAVRATLNSSNGGQIINNGSDIGAFSGNETTGIVRLGSMGNSGGGNSTYDIHISLVSPIRQQRPVTPTENLLSRAASTLTTALETSQTTPAVATNARTLELAAATTTTTSLPNDITDNNRSATSVLGADLSNLSTSDVLHSWLNVRREERSIEAEMGRLRVQLQEQEQEYERTMNAMRAIIEEEQADTTLRDGTTIDPSTTPPLTAVSSNASTASSVNTGTSAPTLGTANISGRSILNAPTLFLPIATPMVALSDDDSTAVGTDDSSDTTGTVSGSGSGDGDVDNHDESTINGSDAVDEDHMALTTEADSDSEVSVEVSTIVSDGSGSDSNELPVLPPPRHITHRRTSPRTNGIVNRQSSSLPSVPGSVHTATPTSNAVSESFATTAVDGGMEQRRISRSFFTVTQNAEDAQRDLYYARSCSADDLDSVSSGSISGAAIDAYIADRNDHDDEAPVQAETTVTLTAIINDIETTDYRTRISLPLPPSPPLHSPERNNRLSTSALGVESITSNNAVTRINNLPDTGGHQHSISFLQHIRSSLSSFGITK